jgi:hypothetical protein
MTKNKPAKKPAAPSTAGYSGTPLPKKLGIKPGTIVSLIDAPDDFDKTLGALPDGAKLVAGDSRDAKLTVWFVSAACELRSEIKRAARCAECGSVWIAWPKKASGVPCDFGENDVRNAGLANGIVDYKICAIDATWSGLCFAKRRAGQKT